MGLSDHDDLELSALVRQAAAGRAFSPPADVYATKDRVVITVELPGIAEDAVEVHAEGADALTVRGRRLPVGPGLAYHRLERSFGEFRCRLALPRGADPSRRRVGLENGVLTIEIPRTLEGKRA